MNAAEATPLRRAGLWRGLGWTLVAAIVALSLVPLSGTAPFAWFDKFEHALAYAVLMWWFAALHAAPGRWRVALAVLTLGAAVEAAQGLTGWRAPEGWDLVADAVGVGIGWVAATLIGARPFLLLERALDGLRR